MLERNIEYVKEVLNDLKWSFDEQSHEDSYEINSGLNIEKLKVQFSILIDLQDLCFIAEFPIKASSDLMPETLSKINRINYSNLRYGKFEMNEDNGIILFSNFFYIKDLTLSKEFAETFIMTSLVALNEFAMDLQRDLL